MKKNKFVSLVFGVTCCLLLTSCFPTEKKISEGKNEEVELNIKDHKIENTLGENLNIKADLPKEIETVKNLTADWVIFNDNLFSSIFFSNEQIIAEKDLPEKDFRNNVRKIYEGANGSLLTVSPGNLNYIKNSYMYKAYGLILSNYDLFKKEDIEKDFQKNEVAALVKPQAVAQANECLQSLGIQHLSEPRVIALDFATLQRKSDELEINIQENKRLDPFTEEDEGYLLIYQAEEYGIPITQTGYYTISSTGKNIPCFGTQIILVVTKEGVINCSIGSLYQTSESSTIKSHKTIQDILEKVNGKYDELLLSDPLTINKVSIEYLPIEKENHWILEPYWILSLVQKTTYTDEKGTFENIETFPLFYSYETGEEKEVEGIQ